MSNYSKTTDFAAKDSLPSGDAAKIIRGSEFETEFDNISTAIATKADSASPTFTGTVTIDGLTVNGNTTLGNAATDTVTVTADIASNLIPSADNTHDLGASGAEWKDLYVDGTAYVDTLDLNGTAVTSTAAELNLLDGATVTTAEINILDGVTATTAEINLLDGVTATTAELNYVDGVTSAIQTQIDTKAPTASPTFTGTVTADVLTVSGDANFDSGTLFVDVSADKVGVGTTSPSATLHAYHATDDTVLKVESGDGQSRIDLIDSGGTARLNSIGSDLRLEADPSNSVANSAIDFKVDGTQVMRINDSFNVGIGTTSPSAKLDVAGTIEFDGLSGTGSVTITDILDEDNMASNSATALATQQSIKAYVDSQVATADTLAEVLGNGNTTGGTDIAVGTGDDITFADSSKAIFGASSDLQIYHDGSNSYIDDAGTGDLYIRANNLRLANADGSEQTINTNNGGNVELAYAGTVRLATTSTGIDVTGTAEADTLETSTASGGLINIVRDDPTIGTNNSLGAIYWNSTEDSGTTVNQGAAILALADQNHSTIASGSRLSLQTTAVSATTPTERLRISAGGDISFYEDTGTTAKLFWDASAESLGIGTSSPASPLTINGTDPLITFENGESPHWQVGFENTQSDRFVFYDNNASAYRMVIDSNGHVGLSHTDFTNYSGKLVVADGSVGGSSFIDIHNNNNNQFVKIGINNNTALIAYDNADEIAFGQMADASGTSLATEHMRIDSSGNVGIGTSSPDTRLDLGSVAASTQTAILARNSTGDADFKLVAGTDSGTASNTSFFEMGIAYETGVYQPNAMLKFFRGGGSTGGFLAFTTNDNTERMRLDGSGNLLVGTTSQSGQITVNNGGNNTGLYVLQSSSSINHTGISVKSSYVTGGQTGTMVRFIQTSDATVGTISSTITATAYNTSSDQRLKDNIVDAPSASDDIDAIQVRSFDWKADGSHQKYGMVAQELQSVAPEAVSTGETEEDMMGVDYSKLVPMMMKEIQSLRARVAQLEGEN